MVNLVFFASLLVLFPASLLAMLVSAFWAGSRGKLLYGVLTADSVFFVYTLAGWLTTMAREDRLGAGGLIAVAMAALFMVVFVITLPILFFRRRAEAPPLLTDWILAAAIAVPVPVMLIFFHGVFARWPGSLVAFLGVASAAWFLLQARKAPKTSFGSKLAYAYAAMVAICAALSLSSAVIVWRAAEAMAAGQPYCIQSGESKTSTILDLGITTLRERFSYGVFAHHHALLVIDEPEKRRVLNWSWRQLAFVSDVSIDNPRTTNHPKIFCQPQ